MHTEINPGSFRDPSGFIFEKNGLLLRQINRCYLKELDILQKSGLMEKLQKNRLLIGHDEVDVRENGLTSDAVRIIQPQKIPFISYPYEWSFSQFADAALLTLEIHKTALLHGMILKDASAYNVQFLSGAPIFIDTLSFEEYKEGKPWVAYGQFCRHFLAPLAAMSHRDIRLLQLLKIYLDGIPLDFAVRLLPKSTIVNPGILMHLHLHASAQRKSATLNGSASGNKQRDIRSAKINKNALIGIAESLERTIRGLKWKPAGTEWADYYKNTNYSESAFLAKKVFVEKTIQDINPETVWDIGANDGFFSRVASCKGAKIISFDIDPGAVEKNYLICKKTGEKNVLPLLMDFTNPSPGIGWMNAERGRMFDRESPDLVLALAIIHHLAIGNNLSLQMIAGLFNRICRKLLIIEFIPKTDSQIQRMLSIKRDVFPQYSENQFLKGFQEYFIVESKTVIADSERNMYLMRKKTGKLLTD